MPVELPRVQRFEPQAPQSVGREEVNAPNIMAATAPAYEGISKGSSKIIEAVDANERAAQKQRLQAMDLKTTELANNFEMTSKERLAQIKLKDGDTSEDYLKYNEDMEKSYKETFSANNSEDPTFQSLLDRKLKSTYGKQQSFRNIQQNEQIYKYGNEVTKNKVKLSQDNLFNAGMYLDAKKPGSFSALDIYRDDIIQSRIAEGDRTGSLQRDDQGIPQHMEGAVGVKIRDDIGNAIVPLVKSLNAAGKVAESRKVIDQYGDYLNASDKSKLNDDANESDVRNQAINLLDNLGKKKGRALLVQDINEAPGEISASVRFKAKELNEIANRQNEAEKDRKREVLLASMYEGLVRKQSSNQPYTSEAEFVNSPDYKNLVDQGLKPSDLNHVRGIVEAPVKSTNSALQSFNEGITSGTLGQWNYAKRTEVMSGLNKDDRVRMDQYRREQIAADKSKESGDLSGSAMNTNQVQMNKSLEEQMKIFKGLDKKNVFPVDKKNKFSKEYDTKLFNQYTDYIRQDLLNLNKNPTAVERSAIIQDRLKQMVEQRKKEYGDNGFFNLFKPKDVQDTTYTPSGALKNIKSKRPALSKSVSNIPAALLPNAASGDTSAAVATPSADNLPKPDDNSSWLKLYQSTNGRRPKNATELNEFKTKALGK